MISERELSQHFHSFWQEQLPLLNPSFIRQYNIQKRERLLSKIGKPIKPLPPSPVIDRFDLVSELAFEWFAADHHSGATSRDLSTQNVLARVASLQGTKDIQPPSSFEIDEAEMLFERYVHFFDSIAERRAIRFRPAIKGVGMLNRMEADFCSQDTIYEVKTVNRNLLSIDIRQVILYIVAGNHSREYNWSNYCIFNPRQAIFYQGNAQDLMQYLSGRTAPECITSMIDALLEREQWLDTRF